MKLLKLFLITSCLISASFLKEAKSADFYVDQSDSSCADDGSASNFCSINAAVTFASDGDNVFIAEGTYTERDIDVTKFINISGAGIDKTVIDATGGYGFNFFIPSPDPTRIINLFDVSIKNANDAAIFSTDTNIYIKSSSFENPASTWTILTQNTVTDTYTLIVEDSTFTNNHGEFYGSAITSENANLIISRTTFTDNDSLLGGTIYAKDGKVTLIDSLMKSNTSDYGASIYQDGGELTILGTTFDNNTAAFAGGALFLANSIKLNISGSTFTNNTAYSFSAFYKDSGTTAIDTSFFSGNVSTNGPALYQNISSGTESSMIITKTVFEANDTTNGGSSAVVAVYGSALIRSSLEISDSTFDTNSNLGDDTAGDLVKAGVVDVGCYTNATIKTSTFYNNTGKNGGAIYIDKCDVDGDGLSETLGVARVINSTFSKNITTENGGAIYNDGILILENVTLANNESISANGGGLYDPDSTNTSIHNSILANNIAPIGPDCFSSIHSEGSNIVSDSTDCTLTNDDTTILATDFLNSDAGLSDSLADNGGTIQTLSLNPGSIALNNGSDCRDEAGTALTTSQNGLDRPQGSTCDIGAFEGGCGDTETQSIFGEECDDGNIVNGDGCDNTCKIEASATTSGGDTTSGDTSAGDTTSGDSTSGDTTSGDTTSGDTGSDDSSESTGGESTGTDDSGASTTTGATDSGTTTSSGSDSSSSDTSGSTTSGSTSGSVIDLGQGNSNATDGGGCSFNSDNL